MFLVALLFGVVLSQSALNVGVWNVMQQPWLTKWTDLVNDNILDNELHVLHLVEVWTHAERDRILSLPRIINKFPYYYWPTERPQPRAGCNMTDRVLSDLVYGFVQCLVGNGVPLNQIIQPLAGPVPPSCLAIGLVLGIHNGDNNNFECLACLINEYMETDPTSPGYPWNVVQTCGANQGAKFGYRGINGQLILSRFPIENVTETFFNGWVANRVNIYATIRGTKFAFGHFAYNFIEDYYPPFSFLMYGDTQPQQAADMLAQSPRPDIIMGDLNTGPDYQPDGYNILISNGYNNTNPNQTYTYCSNSGFQMCQPTPSFPPQTIDHILLRGDARQFKSSNPGTFNTQPLMSDHIGVRAKICRGCPRE
jgi:hypothetical protein